MHKRDLSLTLILLGLIVFIGQVTSMYRQLYAAHVLAVIIGFISSCLIAIRVRFSIKNDKLLNPSAFTPRCVWYGSVWPLPFSMAKNSSSSAGELKTIFSVYINTAAHLVNLQLMYILVVEYIAFPGHSIEGGVRDFILCIWTWKNRHVPGLAGSLGFPNFFRIFFRKVLTNTGGAAMM